jgi:lipopolysaccharide/colanic/teichoic acid biosynthesis glycosyltransferase
MSFYDPVVDALRISSSPDPSSRIQSLQTRPSSRRLYAGFLKRVFDVTAVLLALPIVLPLVALLALLVAFDGCNPFYSQLRIGRAGRPFRLWKLRTMVCDAEARLAEHLERNPAARREWDHKQKLACDPRITLMGRFLRKSSLDELPQLFNVLSGEMSLVGPRPMMVDQKTLYRGRAYYALRPGITGPWQVSERNATGFADRVQFDTTYYKTLSFANDLRLLAATLRVMLRGTGC